MSESVEQFLSRLHHPMLAQIDLSLDRMHRLLGLIGSPHKRLPPVIHVAGTNGKGSLLANLKAIFETAGYRAHRYISPHLVHFEERCRINGEQIAAEALVPHFAAVEAARGDTTLTYFEFTTLAIARALATAGLDLVILEVGLGGRLDAVNAFDADCSVITSVDIDHVEYLGPDRESIGREKAGILRAGRPAIIADPVPPASVIAAGEALGADLWLAGRDFNQQGDRQQWSWSGRGRRYHALSYPALRGANQLLNASGAIAALESLRDRVPVNAQAVRVGLATVELPGRFQIVPGQPTLVLDVAHNAQSVGALALNLDQMGFYPRTIAVLGAMHDKDLASLVARLAPLVDAWHVTDLPLPRAATAAQLAEVVHAAAPKAPPAECHADPASALAAALKGADPADRIVVFGSFYTVGGVLKEGLPRLGAPHQA